MRVCEVSSESSGRDYILTWQWCIHSGSHNSIRCHGLSLVLSLQYAVHMMRCDCTYVAV